LSPPSHNEFVIEELLTNLAAVPRSSEFLRIPLR
jgi:hypothetical protein